MGLSIYTRIGTQAHCSLPVVPQPECGTDPGYIPAMHKVSVHDAEKQLRHLIEAAEHGEEVVITRGDGASFQLAPSRSRCRGLRLVVQKETYG